MANTPRFNRRTGLYGIKRKRGSRPGGSGVRNTMGAGTRPGSLISKKKRNQIKGSIKNFTSGVKDLFSRDNIDNKYASINYLNRNSNKASNKKSSPQESVTPLNQGSKKFESNATALQSDAQSSQIYGGTSGQRAAASKMAATNATDALFQTGSTASSGFQKFGDYGFSLKRGGKIKNKYSQYD